MNNENELTAALATIEKCREITNCPAGIDLQDWVKKLAAENVALKEACGGNGSYRNCQACTFSEYIESPETPATDRIAAGIKADGVEELVSSRGGRWNGTTEEALKFAAQLRKGAAE